MKNLKRVMSLFVVVTMLISMLTVNIFATATDGYKFKINDVETNTGNYVLNDGLTSVDIDVYMVKSDGTDVTISGIAAMDIEYPTAIVKDIEWSANTSYPTGAWTFAKENGYVSIMLESAQDKKVVSSAEKIGTLSFKLNKESIAENTPYAFKAITTYSNTFIGSADVDVTNLVYTANFSPALKVTSVTNPSAITDKAYGTAQSALGLPATVKVATVKQVGGAAGADVDAPVTWSGYDPMAKGDQTLTGTLGVPSGMEGGFDVDSKSAEVKVTLQPVAMSAINVTANVMRKDADEDNVALKEVLPATAALPAIGEMNNDEVALNWTDATVTWNDEGSIATVGSTATVTTKIAADTLSTNGYYKAAADVTVTATVTVIPDNIKGGEIKASNVGASSKGKVAVTVPAAAIAKLDENDEIVAKFFAYDAETVGEEKGSSVAYKVTADEIAAATGEDGKDLTKTLTTAEKMKDLGLGGGTEFAVKVYVDGTLLLNGDLDEYVTAKVLNVSNSPATGIPSGNGGNSGNKDDKKDDATTTPDDEKDDATTPDDGNKDDTTPGTDAPATGFNDVPADHWAADFIKELADAGIINGDEDGNFNTEGKITRAEFTKMVAVLFGLEIKDDATVDFNDCGADDWFVKYVAAAVEAGYINGVGEGTFAPNDTISREDACTILGRALGLAAENANLNFADADAVADYAAQYIALLSELGFINGYEDGTFAPKNEITRAEAAKIIAGIYADKNAAANAGDNTEVEAETETETDAEAEVGEVEAEK